MTPPPPSPWIRRLSGLLPPICSVAAALLIGGLLIQATGASASAALSALLTGATGVHGLGGSGSGGAIDTLLAAQTLARVTPLLLIGLAVGLALRAGLFNIGGLGQMTVGALATALAGWKLAGGADASSATAPVSPLLVGLLLLIGAAFGALWAAIPGYLRAMRGVHEVITTIFFSYIAVNFCDYLVTNHFKDPSSITVQTPEITRAVWLPPLVAGSDLTISLGIALALTVLYAWLLRSTVLGFVIRTVGLGPDAASAAGMPARRSQIVAMALSGALCGLAGALEVLSVDHRFLSGLAGTYGFDGVAVAFLGGGSALGIFVSALLFGGLMSGANYMQMQTNVPTAVAVIVQAVVVIGAASRWPALHLPVKWRMARPAGPTESGIA